MRAATSRASMPEPSQRPGGQRDAAGAGAGEQARRHVAGQRDLGARAHADAARRRRARRRGRGSRGRRRTAPRARARTPASRRSPSRACARRRGDRPARERSRRGRRPATALAIDEHDHLPRGDAPERAASGARCVDCGHDHRSSRGRILRFERATHLEGGVIPQGLAAAIPSRCELSAGARVAVTSAATRPSGRRAREQREPVPGGDQGEQAVRRRRPRSCSAARKPSARAIAASSARARRRRARRSSVRRPILPFV